MRMKQLNLLLVALACGAAGVSMPSPTWGAVVYEFATSAVAAPAGSLVDVPVLLRFSAADAATLLAEQGLLSAGVRLNRTGTAPASPSVPMAINANVAEFNDAIFTPIFLGPTSTQAGAWSFVDIAGLAGVTGQADGTDRVVLLGTITFQMGGTVGEPTTFIASDFDAATDQIVTFDTTPIIYDGQIGNATLTLTPTVPEPASLMAIGLATLGRRRHRA